MLTNKIMGTIWEDDMDYLRPVYYNEDEDMSSLSVFFNDSSTNETFPSWINHTIIGSLDNCTQDSMDEECLAMMDNNPDEILKEILDYIYPTPMEWILILVNLIIFIVGLAGNALVCLAVYRNNSMKTVTNYFIFNLAVADFMVILFCLPPTVVWDVTETWFFGDALCKIILYLQTVSVAVSVLTLTGISVERWYAIVHPLKFKATTKRAKRVILIIWIISLIVAAPELVVLKTVSRTDLGIKTVYLTQCDATWSPEYEIAYGLSRVLILFLIPLTFMSFAYYKIVRVLWSPPGNFPGVREALTNSYSNNSNASTAGQQGMDSSVNYPHHHNHNHHISTSSHQNGIGNNVSCHNAQLLNPPMPNPRQGHSALNSSTSAAAGIDHQLNQRRKAAKMLVAVVAVFGISYLPVHIFNVCILLTSITQSTFITFVAMICHVLPYFNSAINPCIYNMMSGKYRKEFARAVKACFCCSNSYSHTAATSRVYSYNKHNFHHHQLHHPNHRSHRV